MMFSICRCCDIVLLTIVEGFADFIANIPTISDSKSNCIVDIVKDDESVTSVPGSDIIVRRNVIWRC
jgi:hypothetical protein